MKIVKIILLSLVGLIALALLVALFVPKKFTVTYTQTINVPQQAVYDYVRILGNQTQYNIWVMADTNLNPEITGTDGTVGAISKWNSSMDEVGEGEQEITLLTPDRLELDLRFKRPFKGHAKAAYSFKALSATTTEITSEFYSEANYPINLPSYVFGKPMLQKAITQNVTNIKNILEKAALSTPTNE